MRTFFAASIIAFGACLPSIAQEWGLHPKNISATNGDVKLTLENRTQLSGDVVFWVTQNGVQVCAVVTDIEENRPYNLGFRCGEMGDGDFDVSVDWADKKPNIAASARRF